MRRAQCTNNLKQIGLAAANYESTNGSYPGGSYSGTLFNPPHWSTYPENFSCFARMLPFFEQAPMYNAINFTSSSSAGAENLTVGGVQINSLICPSDTQNQTMQLPATQVSASGVVPGWSFNIIPTLFPATTTGFSQAFTSYAGNAGTFTFGFSNLMPSTILANFNGVIYNDSTVKIASVTDGTSNTFMFGEHSKGHLYLLDPGYAISDNCWNSGRWYDTLFATLYPVNLLIGNNISFGGNNASYYYPTCAGSFHPGGANFGLCDGSVRFVKNSIKLVDVQHGQCRLLQGCHARWHDLHDSSHHGALHQDRQLPGQQRRAVGVYQQLSTRAGGEVISSDSY